MAEYVLVGGSADQAKNCRVKVPPEVWVLCRTEEGWRLGNDLHRYEGMVFAGVEVVGENGDPVQLPQG